jgi:hypothetical protein
VTNGQLLVQLSGRGRRDTICFRNKDPSYVLESRSLSNFHGEHLSVRVYAEIGIREMLIQGNWIGEEDIRELLYQKCARFF